VRLQVSGAKIESAAVGITGVAETAYRASAVEGALRGKGTEAIAAAAARAADAVDVLGDYYASSEYRRHLVTVMTRRTLQEAAAKK
jgi:carbon-monoxide dehydrogenase medium subunit